MIRCCTHNPCPYRPKLFLGRFHNRPWICAQCGAWWTTYWAAAFDSGVWMWEKQKASNWESAAPMAPTKKRRWFR